jgi:hypothetical protein
LGIRARVQGLTQTPTFVEPLRIEAGRILLEGGLGVTVAVGP